MYDRMINFINLQPHDYILDVGGGRGQIWDTAQRSIGPEGKVILLDISQPDLYAALSMNGRDGRLFAICGNATHLPMKPASVNVVTTRSVLIYILDKRKVIHEFFRVLCPKGWICLCEPIPSQLEENANFAWGRWHRFRQAIEELRNASWQNPLFRAGMECDDQLLVQLLHEAGFQSVHVERETVPKLERGSPSAILRMWKPPHLASENYHPWHKLLAERFSQKEMESFADFISDAVEAGRLLITLPIVYIWGRKM